jgi:hypothetical protein
MKKAKGVKQKVVGRPRTGIRPLIGFRADDRTRAAIIKWAENQTDTPTLSEAIRRLVELGLSVGAKRKQAPAERAARAKELASKTIDSLTGGPPDNDETASRKRRLIKGPEEFREMRVDRTKTK